jgi:hypothetical protein
LYRENAANENMMAFNTGLAARNPANDGSALRPKPMTGPRDREREREPMPPHPRAQPKAAHGGRLGASGGGSDRSMDLTSDPNSWNSVSHAEETRQGSGELPNRSRAESRRSLPKQTAASSQDDYTMLIPPEDERGFPRPSGAGSAERDAASANTMFLQHDRERDPHAHAAKPSRPAHPIQPQRALADMTPADGDNVPQPRSSRGPPQLQEPALSPRAPAPLGRPPGERAPMFQMSAGHTAQKMQRTPVHPFRRDPVTAEASHSRDHHAQLYSSAQPPRPLPHTPYSAERAEQQQHHTHMAYESSYPQRSYMPSQEHDQPSGPDSQIGQELPQGSALQHAHPALRGCSSHASSDLNTCLSNERTTIASACRSLCLYTLRV